MAPWYWSWNFQPPSLDGLRFLSRSSPRYFIDTGLLLNAVVATRLIRRENARWHSNCASALMAASMSFDNRG